LRSAIASAAFFRDGHEAHPARRRAHPARGPRAAEPSAVPRPGRRSRGGALQSERDRAHCGSARVRTR
jgi:hypothetical protein